MTLVGVIEGFTLDIEAVGLGVRPVPTDDLSLVGDVGGIHPRYAAVRQSRARPAPVAGGLAAGGLLTAWLGMGFKRLRPERLNRPPTSGYSHLRSADLQRRPSQEP